MSSELKPYSRYKDSGVEWLGEVPEHWGVSRLGFETWIRARLGWKGLKASEYVDDGYVLLSTPNIKQNHIDFDNVNYVSESRYEESPEIKVREGDVLLAKDGSTTGTVNLVRNLPRPATVNSSLAVLTARKRIIGRFLYHWIGSEFIQSIIDRMREGMAVPHLFQDDLVRFPCIIPPLPEQHAIADYLDKETGHIDTLISEQRELIELLKEKRQALISHCVTRGLDPDVPMKDSGVEWLGEVPEHWDHGRLKYVCDITTGEKDTQDAVEDGLYPFFVRSQTVERINTYSADCEAVLTAGDGVGVGKVYHYFNGKFDFHQRVYMLNNFKRVTGRFLYYFLSGNFAKVALEGNAKSTVDSLRRPMFLNFTCTLPPLPEQHAIAEYLDAETARIDALIKEAEESINLMKEHRSALISACVTGKVRVPGVADPAAQEQAV